MKIGVVARRCGLSVDTLRYYEKIGLLPKAARDDAGRRRYPVEILNWLQFIARLKATDMPLREISQYARLRAEGPQTGRARRDILDAHRDVIRERIAVLQENLSALEAKIEFYEAEGIDK